ncbi:glycerol-3-phosphate dehydrogenase/oxidase [Simkania negevensis]|uniref:Glycerol-3-phosphate dehydrogenase/oxidase n=1 Tax=Simkania negevensis TaxID=83561 RepID=A0ABS3ARH3_9BACT|nr:glycerol-3-phosphate dehydrogenase/oxidase [Simkania negevensis]
MNRYQMLKRVTDSPLHRFGVIIIGGGATGLGAAVDAAARGHNVLLVEQGDFANGTSSRSTKLIHGGLRYLKQGNISLVLEALRERGLLCKNAPHLIRHRSFLVPNYKWWEGPFYGIGLKIYDMMAGKLGLAPSKHLSYEETIKKIPTLVTEGLRGATLYYDGQFDDARLAIALAQTAADKGATLLNYMQVTGFVKRKDVVKGVIVKDQLTGREHTIQGRVVVNATGVFCDQMRKLDDPQVSNLITLSQGIHLVLDKSFLPTDTAIMVPHTDDGRVLFMVPWYDKVLVGTTETSIKELSLEPRAFSEEVDFLLKHAAQYLSKRPTRDDVRSVFAGLRPLIRKETAQDTASISREHAVTVSPSGLVTIAGGKWTTYRKMGKDVIDLVQTVGEFNEIASTTENLSLYGYSTGIRPDDKLAVYGSEANNILSLIKSDPHLQDFIHPNLPYYLAEVVWHVRHEMAMTLEDVLARRTRALFLDAKASIEAAPKVAEVMSHEFGHNSCWQEEQVEQYTQLAKGYTLT